MTATEPSLGFIPCKYATHLCIYLHVCHTSVYLPARVAHVRAGMSHMRADTLVAYKRADTFAHTHTYHIYITSTRTPHAQADRHTSVHTRRCTYRRSAHTCRGVYLLNALLLYTVYDVYAVYLVNVLRMANVVSSVLLYEVTMYTC